MIPKSLPLILLLLLLNPRIATAQVLMEVPLLLELPGEEELIRAWYDGETFFVDGEELFQALGFSVQLTETGLDALDTHHRHTFSCASLPQDHSCRILMADVLDRLGSALYFDEKRLHLNASSVATTFDVHALRERRSSWTEVPGPHLFGRTRRFWGGVMANWQLRHDAFGVHPSLRLTSSVLLGTVEADVADGYSWVYRYDWPQRTWLTQVEIGQAVNGVTGFSITNLPLARQRLQRMRAIRGQSNPHALIQAVIGGEVVDQVQADAEGNYQLNAPAWYGTTKLEVRTQSLGGVRALSDAHYLFIPNSLLPTGKVYYQLNTGKQRQSLDIQYGLQDRLTLRSTLVRTNRHVDMTTGFTLSPILFMAFSTEVHIPSARWLATLRMWRSEVQVTAHISGQHREFLNTSVTASASKSSFSMLFRGSHSTSVDDYRRLSLHPEVWLHHPKGFLMQASWGLDGLYDASVENGVHTRWRFAAGWLFPRVRLLSFADQDHVQKVYGLEGILTLRHQSLAFNLGWDATSQSAVGSLSFQLSSAFGNFFARGRRDVYGSSYSQQAQGSIHLWSGIKLTPSSHRKSAVELRIFEDLNGNGIQDDTEKILPHIDAQLYQGGWRRLKTGTLYASHLEPYQRYQVRLLEVSIRDPSLYPATGWDFSFTADPGGRKVIHVPMQRLMTIRGQITNLDRTSLRLKVLLNQDKSADVYRDGGFVFHVRPGRYALTVIDVLNQDILAKKTIEVDAESIRVAIDMELEGQ